MKEQGLNGRMWPGRNRWQRGPGRNRFQNRAWKELMVKKGLVETDFGTGPGRNKWQNMDW